MPGLDLLYKFNALTYEQRADKLLAEGVYLRTRNRMQCDVYLFWMPEGEFYGELWLAEGTTELKNIRSFIYKAALEWYPDLYRMSEEELNQRKAQKFSGLDELISGK